MVNITKHAQASQAVVKLQQQNGGIEITVSDNGQGFDKSQVSKTFTENGGFGLFNIHDRLDYLGGDIRIDSQIGGGTSIHIRTPISLS